MAYIVRNQNGAYLQSPSKLDEEEIWFWGINRGSAHHFKSRSEAKGTLRKIDQRPSFRMSNYNLERP